MSGHARLVVAISLFVGTIAASTPAGVALAVSHPRAPLVLNNPQQKVSGEGARGEAQQQNPDVSGAGWAVWWDNRGSLTRQTGDSLWTKDLNTRSEARLTVLSTPISFPRISGTWAVWEDVVNGNREVLARQLPPTGPVLNVTDNTAAQGFPSIDGTQVVWEDSRNAGTTGVDIWTRSIAGGTLGPAVAVTQDVGDQSGPQISGNTVVWTDYSTPDQPRVMGRVMGASPGAEFVIADAVAKTPAISGSRVVWTQGTAVLTCLLNASGCAAAATPVWPSDGEQSSADVSGPRVTWLERDSSDGPDWVWSRDLSVAGANLPSLVDAPANGASGGPSSEGAPKVDGTKLVWTANGFRGTDVFWKDVATTSQPARANSQGLGRFPDQSFVSAAPSSLAYLSDSGDFNPRNTVWATDLTGDRRTIRVSTFADFGTAISPPKIVGNRVVWSDFRDGGLDRMRGPNVLFKDLPGGNETRVTTAGIGGPPDFTGDEIAWLCQESFLCVQRAGLITRIPLPMADGFTADTQVKVSGDVAVWSEFQFVDPQDPGAGWSSAIHAIDVVTGEDEVLGSGTGQPAFIPHYATNGTNVVWLVANGDDQAIYRNNVSFPCNSSCDRSAAASVLASGTGLGVNSIAMDSVRVAWTQSSENFGNDVFVKDIGAAEATASTQVTTTGTAVGDVSLSSDFVYWSDARGKAGFCDSATTGCDSDIFREYVGSGTAPALLPADTAPPAAVTKLAATVGGSGVMVSWTNPSTTDFAGVVVLRKTVPTRARTAPATSVDDPNATIVYDGVGTSFLDTDVASGVGYTYTAFSYDEVPNYSGGVATK